MKTLLVGLAVLALAAASPDAPAPTVPMTVDAPLSSVTVTPTVFGDCATCGNCSNEDHHRLNDTEGGEGPDRAYLESDHPCGGEWGTGTCIARHADVGNDCDEGGFLSLNSDRQIELWHLIQAEDAVGLKAFLAEAGEAVLVNQARGAIQAKSCDGLIKLSLPAPASLIEAMAEA